MRCPARDGGVTPNVGADMGQSASEARQRVVQVVHSSRGRVRAHVGGCSDADAASLERRLRQLTGVKAASANTVTGNVLIVFDADRVSAKNVLATVRAMKSGYPPVRPATRPATGARTGSAAKAFQKGESTGSSASAGRERRAFSPGDTGPVGRAVGAGSL
jgi:Heavy metal associated domain 2